MPSFSPGGKCPPPNIWEVLIIGVIKYKLTQQTTNLLFWWKYFCIFSRWLKMLPLLYSLCFDKDKKIKREGESAPDHFPMKLNLKPNNLARDSWVLFCISLGSHFPGNLHLLPAVEVNTIDLSQVWSRVTTFNLEKLLPGEKIGWSCTSKKKNRNQDAHSLLNWTDS